MARSYSDVLSKYGLKKPATLVRDMSKEEQTDRKIGQLSTRLQSVGVTPATEPEQQTGWLMKALYAIDKPRAALWTAAEHAIKGKDIWEGAKKGWTENETGGDYSGSDLVTDIFGEESEDAGFAEKAGRFVAGFVPEVVLDPLNLVTAGAGSLVKGIATKGTGAVTKEIAEGLAKSAVKKASASSVANAATKAGKAASDDILRAAGQGALSSMDDVAGQATTAAAKASVKTAVETSNKRLVDVMNKYGITEPDTLLRSVDDTVADMDKAAELIGENLNKAQSLIAAREVELARKLTGRGLSIGTNKHYISLISDDALRALGGNFRTLLEKVPVVGKAVAGAAEWGARVFSPKYIAGVGSADQALMRTFEKNMRFTREAADAKTVERLGAIADEMRTVAQGAGIDPKALASRISHAIEGNDVITDVPGAEEIATKLRDWLKEIGESEQDVGLLNEALREVYLPHILTEQPIAKKGGITAKLNVSNASAKPRALGDTLRDANLMYNFHTSSIDAQDAFLAQVFSALKITRPKSGMVSASTLRGMLDDYIQKQAFTFSTDSKMPMDIWVTHFKNKVNDVLRTAADDLDGYAAGFEDSSLKLVLDRALHSNRVLAAQEFLDDVKGAFGTPVRDFRAAVQATKAGKDVVISKQSIRNAIKVSGRDADAVSKLAKIDELVAAAKAAKKTDPNALDGVISSIFGDIPPDDQALLRKLLSADSPFMRLGQEELERVFSGAADALFVNPKIIEAYAFDPGIVDHVNRAANRQIDAGMQALTNVIDIFNKYWKPLVTGLRPAYYIRNELGGTMNNFLSIGLRAFDPLTQIDVGKVLRRRGKVTVGGTHVDANDLYDLALRTGVMSGTHATEYTDDIVRSTTKATGLAAKEKNLVKRVGEGVVGVARKGNSLVESQLRMTNFIANLDNAMERGIPLEQAGKWAADQSRKYHFDYNDITQAERVILRRIMPFYTWMRKNIPLQAEQFLNNPGRYAWYTKWQRNAEDVNGTDMSAIPDYMRQNLSMTLPGMGDKSGATMLTPNLPMQDLNMLSTPGKSLMSALAPLIKIPFEQYQNKNLLTGAPIWKDTDTQEQKFSKQLNYYLQQLGAAGNVARAGINWDESLNPGTEKPVTAALPAYVPGGSLVKRYNVDPAVAQKQLALAAQLQDQVTRLQNSDVVVPTVDDLEGMTPAELRLYKKYGVKPVR